MIPDDQDEPLTEEIAQVPTPAPPAEQPVGRLVVIAGERVGTKFELADEVLIGRGGDAHIQLDDPQISRRHACVRRAEGQLVIDDLASRNGTLLNGVPVTTMPLSFGDRVQLGSSTVLLFTHNDPVEEQILQRQKLEALGRLGAGIAHDFNNLLSAVMSSIEYVRSLPGDRALDDADVRESINDVHVASSRAAELTQRLMGLVRRDRGPHSPVSLTALCDEVCQLLRHTIDHRIRVETHLQPNLRVRGNHGELHQLLMNLCMNARDAMPSGGTLTVRATPATPAQRARVPLPSSGEHVLLEVEDTGVGMDPETRRRAFEPFYTSKPRETGTGLGLATVFEVARSHGGHVDLQSTPGTGTMIRVFLPADTSGHSRGERATARGREGPPRSALDGVRVLLVDDESVVRRSLGRLLRLSGCQVVQARDGEEAIDLFRQARSPMPDVVLLDLDMPRMDGEEAFRVIRELAPSVPVVFLTGYWQGDRAKQLLADGAVDVRSKPYDRQALCEIVSKAVTR